MPKLKLIIPLIVYGIIYCLSFIYWMTFNSEAAWILLLFLTVFIVFDSLLMIESVKKLKIKPLNLSSINNGETRDVTLELTSQSKKPLFFPVLIIECKELNLKKVYFLFYQKEKSITFEWKPTERVVLESVVFKITSSDFFSFLVKKSSYQIETNILVLPAKISNTDRLMNLIYPDLKKTVFGESTFNLEKLAPYKPGDSIKKIDWKLSSKKQHLMVREYEEYAENKLMFVFYGRDSKYFEKMLAVFFSIYQTNISKDILFFLVGEGVSKESGIKVEDFSTIRACEDPGEIPYIPNHKLFIFTPRPTKMLDRELSKINGNQPIKVIEYKTIKDEVSL